MTSSKAWRAGDSILINRMVWDEQEVNRVNGVLEKDWFGAGEFNKEFEKTFSRYIGLKHFQTTNSGSAALEIAIQTLIQSGRLKAGDKILHPALTFPTSISSSIMAGLVPVFVDVDPGTYVISSNGIKQAFVEHPDIAAAVVPLLIGNAFDLDVMLEQLNGKPLIVDSCDTIGTKWLDREFASYGLMGCYSFYGSHHISTFGVGGGIGTDDEELARKITSMTFWGRNFDTDKADRVTSFTRRYSYETIGMDAQMTNVQAAFGLAQLERLSEFLGQREHIFGLLYELFLKYEDYIILPKRVSQKANPSWFSFPITMKNDAPFNKLDLVSYLLDHNVEIRPIMVFLLDQPPYQNIRKFTVGDMPNSIDVSKNGFFIPACPMPKDALEYYMEVLQKFLKKY